MSTDRPAQPTGRDGDRRAQVPARPKLLCAAHSGVRPCWSVGLALNACVGWWWGEDVAALVFLYWLPLAPCSRR
jgi:hypothetical protein